MGKIINISELESLVKQLRSENKIIVTTNGVFDLFHVGHLASLEFSKKEGDILIVGVNSDSSVKNIKDKSRPIIPDSQRTLILASLSCVDYVVLFEEDDALKLINKIRPDIYVKGNEYASIFTPERKFVESYGGKLKFIERTDIKISTSNIISKINELMN